ncbi:putative lipid II flippase FtsW [soil metagenome]
MAPKSAFLLVFSVIFLVALGMVMLLSTSAFSVDHAGDVYYDVKRQAAWLVVAVLACATIAALDYHWLAKGAKVWYVLAVLILVACFIPGIGREVNGASRWIGFGAFRFQPSELAKLAGVVCLAAWYARYADESRHLVRGFVIPLALAGLLVLLIGLEVDLGTAALLGAVSLGIMYVAGAHGGAMLAAVAGGAAALGAVIFLIPNRLGRLLAFLDLEAHQGGFGYQQWHGLLAFGTGGIGGLGLGSGRQKMLYLPFAHTDFIFPMVGEELGLPFTLLVVFFFVVLLVAGCVIALHAPDRFGKLLAAGIVLMITLQAVLNIGVTTAVLPNKGLPLPFVSYGGSNLLCCFLGVGILLNIYRQGIYLKDDHRHPKILRSKLTPRL